MTEDDQTQAVAFLSDPATHGVSGPVEVIETHISRIFLAGDLAYKMKRAVRLPYADFSRVEQRLAVCRAELELNRRTAPELYRQVRRLTREADGRIVFDGAGVLVDAVVEMVRFDQDSLFDRLALSGGLTPRRLEDLAATIAGFHSGAEPVRVGGAANMAGVLDINEAGFATSRIFPPDDVALLNRAFRDRLSRHAAALDQRAAQGWVRRCHGDLHLRNICLIDGKPRLFDCIEFSDQLASVDVLYDLAFLLMDLWHRGLHDLSNLVANRYFDATGEEDGYALLPFFMAVRAAVRAHVTATQAEGAGQGRDALAAQARGYFDLARDLLRDRPARLIALGGFSGSGKTTIAEALAAHVGPPPGARVLESDRLRKAMHGVAPDTRLPQAAYAPEVSARVYAAMIGRAGGILSQGASVVVAAVHDRDADRLAVETAARDGAVPFLGVWLDADPDVLRRRVGARRGGPSDATVEILDLQLDRADADVRWQRIDAARPVAEVVDAILAC